MSLGFYDAVARWNPETGHGLAELIDAACQALIDGLDSPALRELAGASPRDTAEEIGDLVGRTLDELGAGTVRRLGTDSLRLAVVPFQVAVEVNGASLGMGMDPYDVLVPVNRLLATPQPRTVPIARCRACGEYACEPTDVTIVRDGDVVHWDFSTNLPGASFPAVRYDAEVARAAADHSWETADRTAGRLVLTQAKPPGFTLTWAANNHDDPNLFRVHLRRGDDYQVVLDTPWHNRSPEELAAAVCETLARKPRKWRATWHPLPGRRRWPVLSRLTNAPTRDESR